MMNEKIFLERDRMPLLKKWTYFEAATTGVIPDYVYEGVLKYQNERYLIGGDSQWEGKSTFEMVENSREYLAGMLKCNSIDIAFGENTSQMFSILTSGLTMQKNENVIMTDTTFISTAYAWDLKRQNEGIEIRFVKSHEGAIKYKDIISHVDKNTRVISLNHVESNTGFKHDLVEIGEFCREKNIILAVDVAQSAGIMQIDVNKMNISFLAGNNYKWMMNYCGIGYAYIRLQLREKLVSRMAGWRSGANKIDLSNLKLDLKKDAGKYEYGYPNAPGIYAIGMVAQKYLSLGGENIEEYVLGIIEYIHIMTEKFPGIKAWSNFSRKNTSSIIILTADERYDLSTEKLQNEKIFLYVNDGKKYNSKYYMRLGIHYYNNKNDIDKLFNVLKNNRVKEI